jgi:hypothetical protein
LVAIFRADNPASGDHLQGVVEGEGAPAYRPEGIGFYLFAVDGPQRAPLMRCRISSEGHHFLSVDASCEGQIIEGPIGFVGTSPERGLAQLVRCRSGADHLTTLDPAECAIAGYIIEGQQGFASR